MNYILESSLVCKSYMYQFWGNKLPSVDWNPVGVTVNSPSTWLSISFYEYATEWISWTLLPIRKFISLRSNICQNPMTYSYYKFKKRKESLALTSEFPTPYIPLVKCCTSFILVVSTVRHTHPKIFVCKKYLLIFMYLGPL